MAIKNKAPVCPYCNTKSVLVKGDKIYPYRYDLYNLNFYYCDNGHSPAYVGCHKGTIKPLGRLADTELRKAKSEAHKAFDPIWRNGFMRRGDAYSWLAKVMGVSKKDCHIGMFDVDQCKKVKRLAGWKTMKINCENFRKKTFAIIPIKH